MGEQGLTKQKLQLTVVCICRELRDTGAQLHHAASGAGNGRANNMGFLQHCLQVC